MAVNVKLKTYNVEPVLAVPCSLLTAHCLLLTAHCLLLTAHYKQIHYDN